jgi:hypothetical protein
MFFSITIQNNYNDFMYYSSVFDRCIGIYVGFNLLTRTHSKRQVCLQLPLLSLNSNDVFANKGSDIELIKSVI